MNTFNDLNWKYSSKECIIGAEKENILTENRKQDEVMGSWLDLESVYGDNLVTAAINC